MISPAAVFASVFPVYLLILTGAVFRKLRLLHHEHDAGIMRLVFNLLFPCLILDKILGSDALHDGWMVLRTILLGFAAIALGLGTAWIAGRFLKLEKGTGRRTFSLSAGAQNYGFTAIPVTEALWGGSSLAVLFVHNIGAEIAIWTLGLMIMSGESRPNWRRLVNGPLIAVAAALALVFLNLDGIVTGPVRETLSLLGACAFPLAILITGCSMMDLVGTESPDWKIIAGGSLVRLVILPFVILAIARFLPMEPGIRQILIVQAAMPAALTPILLARLYGGKPVIAVQIVIATTVLSFLTLPWIITFGVRWIGLEALAR